MKTFLMFRDRDFDSKQKLPPHERVLVQDLELNTLLYAMAGDDMVLFDVAQRVLLSGLHNDVDTILYRQEIVQDCLKNPAVVRELYHLAVEAIEDQEKRYFRLLGRYPGAILHDSIEMLQIFTGTLRRLRAIADTHSSGFSSTGLTLLFAMVQKEFNDEYFDRILNHLKELKFDRGILLSAELGKGNKGINHVLRLARDAKPNWLKQFLGKGPPAYTFHIAGHDEAGARALSELRDSGIKLVANALAQSTEHIRSFFQMLRVELAFYVGCLNLHDRLTSMGAPMSFPRPETVGTRTLRAHGLYDVCLALTMGRSVVGNAIDANGKSLVIITGANQGGKSCFLRGIGLAQVMMQCGMFVAAESFTAEICTGFFTHFKREEDASMEGGKLNEEIGRLSDIVDSITPNSMFLFNESFASTNEREGSEIAKQIVCALVERRIKVIFVTHLHEFAHEFSYRKTEDTLFLCAERRDDGTRTFRLIEGEPLETSYGEDLYRRIFAVVAADAPSTT